MVLACLSDSDNDICKRDRAIIEFLFPITIDGNNESLYKQVRSTIKPSVLQYFVK